jgi:hypothetical protein
MEATPHLSPSVVEESSLSYFLVVSPQSLGWAGHT